MRVPCVDPRTQHVELQPAIDEALGRLARRGVLLPGDLLRRRPATTRLDHSQLGLLSVATFLVAWLPLGTYR